MSSVDSTIVVGLDESEQSLRAVEWAAAEAAATGSGLIVCHVTPIGPRVDPRLGQVYDDVLAHARRMAQKVVSEVRERWPGLSVTSVITSGPAAAALAAEAAHSRLLVVGCRGVGAFGGLQLGSVSAQVAAHAACPVVVVHGTAAVPPAGAPVLVGVDQSGSEPALAFAFDFAARHNRALVVVHGYRLPTPDPWPDPSLGAPPRSYQRAAVELVGAAVQAWQEKYPDVPVQTLTIDARPAPELIDRSADAALVVVGSRGQGFAGLMLGSVSQHVLRHAECPVAVVRH